MPEFERGGRTPQEWRVLIKKVACYAEGLGYRLFGSSLKYRHSGTEIATLTLTLVQSQRKGYVFRDGHGLYYDFLCQACVRTARALQAACSRQPGAPDLSLIEQCLDELGDDDTP